MFKSRGIKNKESRGTDLVGKHKCRLEEAERC